MSDPTQSSSGNVWDLDKGSQVAIVKASRDVWAEISALIDARVEAKIVDLMLNQGGVANIACTMGTPGVDATASAAPWGFVVVPFPAIVQRIEYFSYPEGGAYTVDLKIIRPGLTLATAQNFYPAPPPEMLEDMRLITHWISYIEAGSVMVFYLTTASGVQLVTANLILRTVQG